MTLEQSSQRARTALMRTVRSEVREAAVLFVLGSVFVLFSLFCQFRTAGPDLLVEIEAAEMDEFKVYWRAADGHFQERDSWSTEMEGAETTVVSLTLPHLGQARYLRIDPGTIPGTSIVRQARLSYGQNNVRDLLPVIGSAALVRTNDLTIESHGDQLHLISSGDDPYFEILKPIDRSLVLRWQLTVPAALLMLAILYLALNQRLLRGSRHNGTLQVALPTDKQLIIPPDIFQTYRLRHQEVERFRETTRYRFSVARIAPQDIAHLIAWCKQYNHAADVHFQYRRCGEN